MNTREAIAARILQLCRERGITPNGLTNMLPYHPYDRPTPIPPGFDGTFYPPGMETVPKWAAIVHANRYMVEHSDYLERAFLTYFLHIPLII